MAGNGFADSVKQLFLAVAVLILQLISIMYAVQVLPVFSKTHLLLPAPNVLPHQVSLPAFLPDPDGVGASSMICGFDQS